MNTPAVSDIRTADPIIDATFRYAETVRAVKLAQRRFKELNKEARAFRDAQLFPALHAMTKARSALDRATGLDAVLLSDAVIEKAFEAGADEVGE